jgi:hemolysin III
VTRQSHSLRVAELLFHIKPISEDSAPAPADLAPGQIAWNYDRAEIIADGVVHAAGLVLGLIGAAIVIVILRARPAAFAPTLIYMIGLMAMLGISAAYNMWPISPTKWLLRRFDHSAIYLLIAGTYTPFLALMKSGLAFAGLTAGIWSSALVGVLLKLALPGRFDRLSIALYLMLGWIGIIAYDHLLPVIPSASLWLLAIGGVLYSLGTLFHLWERLRFQNAIWHGFVLLAAGCHYSAVLACLPAM